MSIGTLGLREPLEFTADGVDKVYLISKFKAIAGRDIVTNYPVTGLPKIGDYKSNEVIMLKLMSHVAVVVGEDDAIILDSQALVDNHVPDWETLAKIEVAMMQYNCSFFQDGKISSFLDIIKATALQLISEISTDSAAPLSQRVKQVFENLQNITH